MQWFNTVLSYTANIVGNLFVQLTFTVGLVILYGVFISLCNRLFYDACGDRAFWIVRLTGYIGTPIHELSHALMCLLFGHSVKKVSLFGDSPKSKTLGYVEHTYRRGNMYHQLGNFFIGVSPVLAGGIVILLLIRFATPSLYGNMWVSAEQMKAFLSFQMSVSDILSVFDSLFSILLAILSPRNFINWRWWLCMLLVFSVALHMEISRSDIRSGLKGLGVITVMLLITDVILGVLFHEQHALSSFTSYCFSAGVFLGSFMIIPAVFSALIGLASLFGILAREGAKSIRNDSGKEKFDPLSVHGHKKTEEVEEES